MDFLIITLAGALVILGLLGSFLPLLPGIPLSWTGLLLLHFSSNVPMDYMFLGVTLLVSIIIFVLQYAIPALGTKLLGGSKSGMIGATAGLIAGIFIPIPFAIVIVPFIGAYIGEIIGKADSSTAFRAATGSFVGLLTSSFIEFIATCVFLVLFFYKLWENRAAVTAF